MNDTCTCGHDLDEHDGNVCAVDGCPCVHFEAEEGD